MFEVELRGGLMVEEVRDVGRGENPKAMLMDGWYCWKTRGKKGERKESEREIN